MKVSRFWDVVVVSENGDWVGFRTPFGALRRTASYFSLAVLLCVVSLTGWLMSRWQAQRMSDRWASERLKAAALEAQLADLRAPRAGLLLGGLGAGAGGALGASGATGTMGTTGTSEAAANVTGGVTGGAPVPLTVPSSLSVLPSLDSDELKSNALQLDEFSTEYNPGTREWALNFEIVRQTPREGSARYYWVALVHGVQGMLVFPPALASRKGEALLFHRGQALDDVRTRRAVSARFKLEGFMERVEAEPAYATLLVYDNKGTLLIRRRGEISVKRRTAAGSEP